MGYSREEIKEALTDNYKFENLLTLLSAGGENIRAGTFVENASVLCYDPEEEKVKFPDWSVTRHSEVMERGRIWIAEAPDVCWGKCKPEEEEVGFFHTHPGGIAGGFSSGDILIGVKEKDNLMCLGGKEKEWKEGYPIPKAKAKCVFAPDEDLKEAKKELQERGITTLKEAGYRSDEVFDISPYEEVFSLEKEI